MIGPLLLIAAQAAVGSAQAEPQIILQAEETGAIPDDCEHHEEELADGADQDELLDFAYCLTSQQDEPSRVSFDRGISYYRMLQERRDLAYSGRPVIGGIPFQLVYAFAEFGDIPAMIAEADGLAHFAEDDPQFLCNFFGRMHLGLELQQYSQGANALADRFDFASCPPFVPAVEEQDKTRAAYLELSLGDQLIVMGDASFQAENLLGEREASYRFTVMPWRHQSISARIDFYEDRPANLHLSRMAEGFPYDPFTFTRQLTPAEEAAMRQALEGADLHASPFHTYPRGIQEQPIVVCGDGTLAVLELLDARGHALIRRHSCDRRTQEVAALMRMMFGMLPEGFTAIEADSLFSRYSGGD